MREVFLFNDAVNSEDYIVSGKMNEQWLQNIVRMTLTRNSRIIL